MTQLEIGSKRAPALMLLPKGRKAVPRLGGVPIPAAQLLVLLALLAIWQGVVDFGFVREIFISKPTAIFASLSRSIIQGGLLLNLGVTVYETVIGFIAASVAGIAIGILLYQAPRLNLIVRPFITALNNLPRLALAPLFVLWFGLDTTSHVVLILSVVFFIVMFNTYAGLQSANRDHLLLAKTLGATQQQLFIKFILPSAVPTIFAGLQLGLTYAFLTAVVGEMLSGSTGLGAILQITLATYRTNDFFAALLLLTVVATALSSAMRLLERYLLRWRAYELSGLRTIDH